MRTLGRIERVALQRIMEKRIGMGISKIAAFAAMVFMQVSCICAQTVTSKTTIPIQVLLLDGQSAGAFHNWKLTTTILKKELEETGLFQVTVVTAPPSDGDFSNFKPEFSHYKVIVSNLDSPDWPENLRLQFEQFVSNGGGFVVVHATDNAFPSWPPRPKRSASQSDRK